MRIHYTFRQKEEFYDLNFSSTVQKWHPITRADAVNQASGAYWTL